MKKSEIVMIGIGIFIVAFVANMFWGSASLGNNSLTGSAVVVTGEDAQIIEIGLDRSGFRPAVVTVQANKPVILKNDGTLGGCGLYIIQPELGLNANFARDDTYTFTPTIKGTFTYTCSMGMFKGTMKVV